MQYKKKALFKAAATKSAEQLLQPIRSILCYISKGDRINPSVDLETDAQVGRMVVAYAFG